MLKFAIPLYLLTLGFLSLNPWLRPDSNVAVGFLTWDLIDHALAYSGLTILCIKYFSSSWIKNLATVTAVAATSFTGLSMEFGQLWLTDNRSFSYHDVVANACGALTGALLYWLGSQLFGRTWMGRMFQRLR